MNFLTKQLLRILEKIPGLCLLQVANFGDVKILMLPKVGTRSIRNSLISFHYGSTHGVSKSSAWHHISYHTRNSLNRELERDNIKLLVFIRDPQKRIASCWRQKISAPEGILPYFVFYFPFLYPRMPYHKFVSRILTIPVPLMEKHFMPVSYTLEKIDQSRLKILSVDQLSTVLQKLVPNDLIEHANSTKSLTVHDSDKDVGIESSSVYKKDFMLWQSTQQH